jgi:hypothetical protein
LLIQHIASSANSRVAGKWKLIGSSEDVDDPFVLLVGSFLVQEQRFREVEFARYGLFLFLRYFVSKVRGNDDDREGIAFVRYLGEDIEGYEGKGVHFVCFEGIMNEMNEMDGRGMRSGE